MSDQAAEPLAYTDPPNTHHYERPIPFTEWAVLTATDFEGVQHWFHVPAEAVRSSLVSLPLDSLSPPMTDQAAEPLSAEEEAELREIARVRPMQRAITYEQRAVARLLAVLDAARASAGPGLDVQQDSCPCGHEDNAHVHYCSEDTGDGCDCNVEYVRLPVGMSDMSDYEGYVGTEGEK